MQDLEHARQMPALAENELKALRGMTDVKTFSPEIFGFHAQQAVEKALKSWLSLLGVAYPKIHDLEELFSLIQRQESAPENLLPLISLTSFAVQFRYEVVEGHGQPLQRDQTISQVSVLLDHVNERLERAEK